VAQVAELKAAEAAHTHTEQMLRGIVERQLDDNQKLMALVSDLQQQRNLLTSEWAGAAVPGQCMLVCGASSGYLCTLLLMQGTKAAGGRASGALCPWMCVQLLWQTTSN
jgi:hypothetical protein